MAKRITEIKLKILWDDHEDTFGPTPHPRDWDYNEFLAMSTEKGENVSVMWAEDIGQWRGHA